MFCQVAFNKNTTLKLKLFLQHPVARHIAVYRCVVVVKYCCRAGAAVYFRVRERSLRTARSSSGRRSVKFHQSFPGRTVKSAETDQSAGEIP